MKLDFKNPTKNENEYNEIYRNIFHILGFGDDKRELCEKLTKQSIKEITRAKKGRFSHEKLLKLL